jgi:hypothetical protein
LGDAALAGWYGLASPTASVGARFGATDGDQTTGGILSFGDANNANRALGLLATSSTGYTAFGAKLFNLTTGTLNYLTLSFTGEVWRQSNVPKTLQFYYFLDPTGTNTFSTTATATLSALNVSFPTVSADSGGAAVDGTLSANQLVLGVTNELIVPWPSGAALWLVWEMADATGKAQGLAIDNLTFSAVAQIPLGPPPPLGAVYSAGNLVLSWPSLANQNYQVMFTTNLATGPWTALGSPLSGNGGTLTFIAQPTTPQGYYRLTVTH